MLPSPRRPPLEEHRLPAGQARLIGGWVRLRLGLGSLLAARSYLGCCKSKVKSAPGHRPKPPQRLTSCAGYSRRSGIEPLDHCPIRTPKIYCINQGGRLDRVARDVGHAVRALCSRGAGPLRNCGALLRLHRRVASTAVHHELHRRGGGGARGGGAEPRGADAGGSGGASGLPGRQFSAVPRWGAHAKLAACHGRPARPAPRPPGQPRARVPRRPRRRHLHPFGRHEPAQGPGVQGGGAARGGRRLQERAVVPDHRGRVWRAGAAARGGRRDGGAGRGAAGGSGGGRRACGGLRGRARAQDAGPGHRAKHGQHRCVHRGLQAPRRARGEAVRIGALASSRSASPWPVSHVGSLAPVTLVTCCHAP
mmetsp:Transcript_7642/g.19654  ORF Transcript_7642/g.19654 Transcript_7642/m.19654 type:complete len:365 (-) Transcript_7642:137-1231(-)